MTAARTLKTLDDWRAQPDEANVELVDGELVQRAAPMLRHSVAQLRVGAWVQQHFGGVPPGGHRPDWVFGVEADIALSPARVVRPDIAGWRLAHHPGLLAKMGERPLTEIPDWVCEVLSDSNAKHDLQTKVGLYAEARVAHYWVLDPGARRLLVYRWTERGYPALLHAKAGQTVRAEPFDAVELRVAELLGE